jgi:hypothetical protein
VDGQVIFEESQMTRQERVRAVHRRLRETHRKLFDLQGEAIVGLREALNAVSRTHDEMMGLFEAINSLEDIADEEDGKP